MKNKEIKKQVIKSANDILILYKDISNNSTNIWHRIESKQAYRDCLEVLKRNNLIEDYNFSKMEIIEKIIKK